MAKQLNVNLAFTADTSKAKAQLQDLQNQLSQVINMPTAGLGEKMATEINQAAHAAAELKVHLQNATNAKTGNLDFTKLNQSIKNSGSSLTEYAKKIQSIGPEGQKAFMLLAQSVASAEVPIRRSNALLSELWTTMKNTARWQLTSSMLHGFMGAVQSAVGYTEDLNESLNNIRIVTGNSVEQMADFAKEANKAAKALSTSTTNYTNAALIYYQQGLDEQQVLDRADITVKMANVSRQSAEEVSDQMTAIWNNFYDGSQSLEHYADAMTRLGADTASSSDEIAQGLEKFAAIGDMIGLSFDNAAAALATVTATTRQSADVVGTAFKTIFARIQGLSLGETLEDGTNLNKYSEALQKVGISIFEQNGELKDMDNILDEMGAKWKTMSKDQQVALAQTVAGVRQYNQLVALMDNYDFYEQNLFSAQTADGSLQEQADIYAESWEAASERVDAALEGLYDSLINDEAFIDLLNGIEKIVSATEMMVDSMGGFGGVISGLGVIFTRVFRKQITQSITDASYSLMSWTEKGRQKIQQEKLDQFSQMLQNAEIGKTERAVLEAQFKSYQQLTEKAKDLTDLERETYQILLDQQKARGKLAIQKKEEADQAKIQANDARAEAKWALKDAFGSKKIRIKPGKKGLVDNEGAIQEYENAVKSMFVARSEYLEARNNNSKDVKTFEDKYFNASKAVKNLEEKLKEAKEGLLSYKKALEEEYKKQKQADAALEEATGTIREESDEINNNTTGQNQNADSTERNAEAHGDLGEAAEEAAEAIEEQNDKLNSSDIARNFVAGANAAMSAVSAIQAFSSAIDIINSDAEPMEKLTSVLMSVPMGVTMAGNALNSLNKIMVNNTTTLGQAAAKTGLASKALKAFKIPITEVGTGAVTTGAAIGALALYATIAVAAIVALTEAIKFGIDVYNEDANAAKSAAEAAQNLSDKAKEAQSSVDDLLSTFDSYDSAVDKLNECTKGTDEWNEALTNVNDQMWEILDKYPELAKMDNIFKDGLLNHDVLDDYIAQQKKAAENARAAALTASARSSKAQIKADETALKREINLTVSQNTYYDDQGTIALQNQVHAQKMFADLYEKASDKNFNTEEFNAAVNEYIEGFSMTSEGFEDEIRDTADKIRDLGKASIQASTQMENAAKLLANQILGEDATEDQVNDFATKYAEAEELLYNEVIAETRNGINKLSGKNDAEVKALWERYQKATGTNYSLSSNAVQGTDYNRSFEYINEEGIKVVISAEELAAAIAASEAQSETQEDFRNNLFDANSGALGFFGSDVIKDGVDTSLLNSLAETMDLEDAETVAALQTILNDKQTAAEQIAEINKLLGSMTEEEKAQAEIDSLTKNAVDNYELDADDIEDQAKRLQEAYQLTSVEATKLAIENQRMNKGVETLSENWEDWQKVLKKGSLNKEEKLTLDYTNTIQDLTKAVADLTGASEDLELPDEFFESEENLKLIEEAAKGSEQAINELGVAVGYASVQLMELKAVTDENGSILNQADIDAFNTNKEIVLAGITELQAKVAEGTNLVGQGLDAILSGGAEGASSWVTSLNEMAMATNMTVEEMNALLGQLGLEADVTTTDIEQEVQVPVYKVQMSGVETDPETGFTSYTTRSIPMGTETHKGKISVAQIGVNGVDPGVPDVKYIGNGPVSPSSVKPPKNTGGNKGSKPKKVNKSDIVDRYKEINDQLDNVKDAYEDASKEADRLYGASRISAMKRANNEIQKEIGLLEKKKEEAQKYLKLDKEALELAAKQAGVQLEFQDNEIVNYTAVLEQLYNQLKALIDAAGETVDEAEQEAIDKLQEKIDELKSAIKAFDDTKESIEDTDNDIKDKFYEWQDNNYEELSHKLEFEIDINDAELQKLEYFLNKYSDDFYKMAESIALMTDKIEPVKNNLEDYRVQEETLSQAYEKGKISREAYIKGLKEVREGYYENLETLNELNKEMLEYYENTLSAAKDELNDYTDHMEHLTGVLDHYLNLMDILGKQKDYDAIGNFLNGKASITRDRLDVAKDYYQILLEQKETVKAELNAAIESGDEALIKLHQKEWDAIVDATDEAQEEVLSLTEEWAQSMQEIIKNNMTKIADELEKSLTNGFGFDFLLDQWDRINTQQEEYLDKTNQIYETNKMMRTAQKALDETTNKVAKQKLKNFIEETARLQENTKLSKHELEIRQAQYDLLLAEIALEEAQNAKSTVRLSRDSEGNFGYIYTADEDKVNEAEQNLDDKRNNIYNLSLEGQKEYMDKYLQASKEMYDELNELQAQYLEGLLTEEEFKLRSEAIKKYYLGSSEFQKAMADLEEEYRRGNLGSEEEYNRLRQEIIRKYSAEDIGILNQYLDIANTSNRIAREEDAKLQQKYQDENVISQEEYYKKKAEMIKSFNENMATLDKAYYEDGALTEAEYNQLRENLTNKFHNDMKELNNTYYQDGIENENKFNQEKEALTNKYHSDLKALNDAFYIDGTISEEEYNNERNALTKKYHDDINALTKSYYKTGLENDKNYNEEKAELINTFANDSEGVLSDFFDFYLDKTESTGDNASESWGDNLGNMAHSTSDWSDDVNDYLDEVEEGAEDMRDVYEEVNEDLEDALENSAETTEDLKDESDDLRKEIKNKVIPAIKDEIKEVKNLTTEYGKQTSELNRLIKKYEEYLDLIGEEIEHHSIETEEPEIQIPKEEQTETPSAEEKPVNNSEAKKIAKEAQEIINKVHYGKDGMTEGNNGWAPNARKKGYSEEAIAIAKKAFNDSKDGSGYSYFYEEALKLAGQYNTGGYTGAWGPEGKLAFLHEKELILNKDDTENILNTVSFIRDIVSMIDNKANMSSLFSMSAMAGITSGNMGMEQQVTIYAEFPDATDHNEIEQAFNSLLNTASQYANRK